MMSTDKPSVLNMPTSILLSSHTVFNLIYSMPEFVVVGCPGSFMNTFIKIL